MGGLGLMGCDVVKIILMKVNVRIISTVALVQSEIASSDRDHLLCPSSARGNLPGTVVLFVVKKVTYDRWSGWCFHQG